MKTINTVLPVYDRKEKQAYERAKKSLKDDMYSVTTPRFRLPSMLWNVESDDPGVITHIEMIDRDGNKAVNVHGMGEWPHDASIGAEKWYNYLGSFGTLTIQQLDILSAIIVPVGGATARTQYMYLRAGDVITLTGNLTINSGPDPIFELRDLAYVVVTGGGTGIAGVSSYSWTITNDNYYQIVFTGGNPASGGNYSFTGVTIETTNFINHFWDGEGAMSDVVNDNYDTFTQASNNTPTFVATKTTAGGEARCAGVISVTGSGSFPAVLGKRMRFDCYLTLTSGTAPKIELRDAANWGSAARSNTIQLVAGRNAFVLESNLNTGANIKPIIYNGDGESSNFTMIFAAAYVDAFEPKIYDEITDEYFQYNGNTLAWLLPTGEYYLKFFTDNGNVYYSDYFHVDCVFDNLITAWTNGTYNTFNSSDTIINSAIETGVDGFSYSNTFRIIKGDTIKVIFYHTQNSGDLPKVFLRDILNTIDCSTDYNVVSGLNVIDIVATLNSDTANVVIYNTTAANYLTSEVLVMREFSDEYFIINFSNTCDLGDILYQAGLVQTVYLESEPMEIAFPTELQGQNNGEGKFVRTFTRQVKKYTARLLPLPDYMVDVFNRMRLHDTVELIDLVGDEHDLYNLEVEHEWISPGKYYARIDLTFDYDEAVVAGSCCVDIE